MKELTAEEKWGRLTSPETLADYGLTLNASELATFPEGRAVLAELCEARETRAQENGCAQAMGARCADVLMQLCASIPPRP